MTPALRSLRVLLVSALIAAFMAQPPSVSAQSQTTVAAGSLDRSFAGKGFAVTDLGNRDEHLRAVAVQPDGKIVAAGYTQTGHQFQIALIRLNSNGTPDASFGDRGTAITEFNEHHAHAHGIALQTDGKILVVGHTHTLANDDFIMARYTKNGRLDAAFGADGKVELDFDGGFDFAFGTAVQPDGKILVAGTASIDGNYDFALARFSTDGVLDSSFGTGGKATSDFGTEDVTVNDTAQALALQPDGKIVLAGYSGSDFALARYSADGVLDSSFGKGGKVTTNLGKSTHRIYAVAALPNGKIVGMGRSFSDVNSDVDFEVARYNSDGSLDDTFGDGGTVRTDLGAGEYGYGGVVQPDGRIVMAGFIYDPALGTEPASHQQLLVRYRSDGSLDESFGDGGTVRTSVGKEDQLYSVAMQADAKIVVAGNSGIDGDYDLVVARYHSERSSPAPPRPTYSVVPQPPTVPPTVPPAGPPTAAAPPEPATGPPTVASPLDDVNLNGPEWLEMSLSGVFHDPDGDDLTFTAESSNDGVVSVWLDGSSLTVVGIFADTATITVTAQDSDGDRVSDAFDVTVMPDP